MKTRLSRSPFAGNLATNGRQRWRRSLLPAHSFILLTVLRLRQWVVEAVPLSLRYSFAVGIGLFLTFIGLNQTGIVVLGVAGAPVRAGHLTTAPVLVAICGFLLLSVLVIRKVSRRDSAGHCRYRRYCFCCQDCGAASALPEPAAGLWPHSVAARLPRRALPGAPFPWCLPSSSWRLSTPWER